VRHLFNIYFLGSNQIKSKCPANLKWRGLVFERKRAGRSRQRSIMARPLKRCKFIDDAAELSGEDQGESGDEDNCPEENEDDRKFVDDSSLPSEEDRKVSKVNKRREY